MLEDVAGLSTATVGAAMFPLAVVSAAVTPVVTWSMRHWGAGRIVTIGAALSLASCGAAALLVTAPSLAIGVTSACILGLSNGVVSIAVSQRVFEASDPSQIGASAGLFQSVRYVGAIAAAGLLGLVFDETASVNGWAVAVLVAGLCCIYAWALAGRSSR
jgi:predicted MFS family arabinose efflux permease